MTAAAAWIYLYLAYLCTQRVDPDFGWHLRSGEHILRHGVPQHDIFSYTAANFPWVNHEWLNDVIVSVIAHAAGYFVLGLVYATIWTAALVLAMKRSTWPAWATAGLALGALFLYVGIRPVAWTALGLALALRILDGKPHRYWLLVPLAAIWANLHAGFAAGLVLVLLRVVVDRSWALARWGAVAALATLLNPFGVGLYVELWRTLADSRLHAQIVEWQPLPMNTAVAPYVVLIAVTLIEGKRWDFAWALGAGVTAATVSTGRHMPLMVVGTLQMLQAELNYGWERLRSHWNWAVWGRRGAAILVGLAYPAALLVWPPQLSPAPRLHRPLAEVAALRAQPCRGRMFNDYNYGGYLIWALSSVPVYIDGRMPSWSGPQGRYLDVYSRVLDDGRTADAEFARYNVRCALISKIDTKLARHLASTPGWRLALKADDAELWRRD